MTLQMFFYYYFLFFIFIEMFYQRFLKTLQNYFDENLWYSIVFCKKWLLAMKNDWCLIHELLCKYVLKNVFYFFVKNDDDDNDFDINITRIYYILLLKLRRGQDMMRWRWSVISSLMYFPFFCIFLKVNILLLKFFFSLLINFFNDVTWQI